MLTTDGNTKFEIRVLKPFQAKSQSYTLPASYADGKGGTTVLANGFDVKKVRVQTVEDRNNYASMGLMDINLSPMQPTFRVIKGQLSREQETEVRNFFIKHPDVVNLNDKTEYDPIKKEAIGSKANANFVFEDFSKTTRSAIEEIQRTTVINTLLMSNMSNRQVLKSMLFFLGENPSESMDTEEMYVTLTNLTSPLDGRHRELFYSTYVEKAILESDIKNTVLVNTAIAKGEIELRSGVYKYGAESIGTKLEQVVLWVKNNDSARTALERSLGLEESAKPAPAKPVATAKPAEKHTPSATQTAIVTAYTDEEFAVVTALCQELGVQTKGLHLVGNTPSGPRQCTLQNLLNVVNEKGAGMPSSVKIEVEDVARLLQMSESIKPSLEALKSVKGM